jgi:F-type H+-transporting ATPase subunit a
MHGSDVIPQVIARFGPLQITATVVYTLIVSALIIAFALVVHSRLKGGLSTWQIGAETLIDFLDNTMRGLLDDDPRPYTPIVATLALFIGVSNLSGLVPGLHAPTADLSTTAALAIVVCFTVPYFGIRKRGIGGYLHHYLEPTPILLPIEVFSEISRVLTLAVRLFGNVMSGELMISVLVALVGFLVPIPIMLLEVLTGLVQAYIFTVLTMVYISSAVKSQEG